MGTVSRAAEFVAIETARREFRAPEESFGSIFADIARVLWPAKTAANVAATVGCSERAAEFYLSGQREWSGDAIAAITAEILRRHAMRNVRVISR